MPVLLSTWKRHGFICEILKNDSGYEAYALYPGALQKYVGAFATYNGAKKGIEDTITKYLKKAK